MGRIESRAPAVALAATVLHRCADRALGHRASGRVGAVWSSNGRPGAHLDEVGGRRLGGTLGQTTLKAKLR